MLLFNVLYSSNVKDRKIKRDEGKRGLRGSDSAIIDDSGMLDPLDCV